MTKKNTTYKDAGVDIEKANALVGDIKAIAKRTQRPGILAGIGGFGALFEVPTGYDNPVLVSGTDGVGTKLKLAIELDQHDTIGIDLVAMCVNDIICLGAEPLFFLDYYATGHLNSAQAKSIISGIGAGCELAGCALIGGETAEMPGMYHNGDYDLAGFCVGVVEKSKIMDGTAVSEGDVIVALPSSGPHSNGYSLIRHIIDTNHIDISQSLNKKPLSDHLLTPTRIYAKAIQSLLKVVDVHALAHITGGGLTENIPRVLPHTTQAELIKNSWEWPAIFTWLQETGNITFDEMMKSFNMGVGMTIIVAHSDVDKTLAALSDAGEQPLVIGKIAARATDTSPQVLFE